MSCSLIAAQYFDTSVAGQLSNAVNLANFIQNATDGAVLVGVTAYDPMTSLSPAFAALSTLRVSVNDVQVKGSFAFLAPKGQSSMTLFTKCVNANNRAAELNVRIQGTNSKSNILVWSWFRLSCRIVCVRAELIFA